MTAGTVVCHVNQCISMPPRICMNYGWASQSFPRLSPNWIIYKIGVT